MSSLRTCRACPWGLFGTISGAIDSRGKRARRRCHARESGRFEGVGLLCLSRASSLTAELVKAVAASGCADEVKPAPLHSSRTGLVGNNSLLLLCCDARMYAETQLCPTDRRRTAR